MTIDENYERRIDALMKDIACMLDLAQKRGIHLSDELAADVGILLRGGPFEAPEQQPLSPAKEQTEPAYPGLTRS